MNTIYALASARGKAGVAVVRVSGSAAHGALTALAGDLPAARRLVLRRLVWLGEPLDDALVARFDQGASFTGEDCVELHLHGGQATVAAVLRALGSLAGLRLAEPGEFTRRAFENGVLGLSEVEGLADLIDSETEAQRRQAFRVMSGAIRDRAEGWRRSLIRAAALVEATIDFADEDVPVDVRPEVGALLEEVLVSLRQEVAGSHIAERVRDGFEVAIIGAPNVGKSTLLNALAGREAAITSERAGTTRDVIEVRMDIGGLAVMLLDTAGLREAADDIEAEGISRALRRAAMADLRVVLLADGESIPADVAVQPGDLVVRAKADLGVSGGLAVSGKTGAGLRELTEAISAELSGRVQSAGTLVRERHRMAATAAIGALESARDALEAVPDKAELVAEALRRGLRALESLVGRVDVEDFLDEIFASFCIGK
jgi:tRNA modification GTPase